jgi:AraC family transcriptional regulator
MRGIGAKRFNKSIDRPEPRIVDLDRPIEIVGVAVETNVKRVYRDVPALGKRFRAYKRTHDIPNLKQPWGFAAVSKDFDPQTGAFSYIIGDVVTNLEDVPEGLTPFEIPAIKYAVFPVRPRHRWGWARAIVDTKKYVYNVWLPQSEYEPAGTVDDFEYHDDRSLRRSDPEIDLYVAIKQRGPT